MNRREKLHAAKERLRTAVIAGLDESGIADEARRSAALDVVLAAFDAGYDAAEPDVCARCGAEIESDDERE